MLVLVEKDTTYFSRKPSACPRCGSTRVATIVYGYPLESILLKNKVKSGQIVLSGRVGSDDSPAWKCRDCGYDIHKAVRLGSLVKILRFDSRHRR